MGNLRLYEDVHKREKSCLSQVEEMIEQGDSLKTLEFTIFQ